MPTDRYPAAGWEPVDYASEAGSMTLPVLGWVEHVVVGNGDPVNVFRTAPAGSRRFSHLWFAKNGDVKQYQQLSHASWAQVAGNGSYWSCETEGNPDEPLTDAQLDALAAWHVWAGAVDALASAPGQRGIGTHQMGGAAWGGHACPGSIRAGQRTEILHRAAIIRGGTNVTPAEIDAVANAVLAKLLSYVPPTGENGSDGRPLTLPWVLTRNYHSLERIEAAIVTAKP